MKIVITLTCIFLFSILNLNAQEEDLNAIFDDGNANRKLGLNLGIDAITLMAGTLNIYGEAIVKEKFGLFVGTGIMPFGYLADFSDPKFLLSQSGTALTRNFTRGRFLDAGMKLLQKSGSFSYYYYLGFKYWHFDEPSNTNGTLINSIRKLTLGAGYTFSPTNHFQFDLHGGAYVGAIDKKTVTNQNVTLDLRVGFDLGFSMFYKF